MNPQLEPTSAIANTASVGTGDWFDYPVHAYPHQTDYGGIVWHGTYLSWMEEARVKCLQSIGISFADLVAMGCDLPVVDLSVRYHRPVQMGRDAIVRTRMAKMEGIRINWDYQIQSPDGSELYVSAQVTLVAVDREKGRILRQLPTAVQQVLMKLQAK